MASVSLLKCTGKSYLKEGDAKFLGLLLAGALLIFFSSSSVLAFDTSINIFVGNGTDSSPATHLSVCNGDCNIPNYARRLRGFC